MNTPAVLTVLLASFVVSGCTECKVEYQPGDVVYGRLDHEEYLVIKQADIQNYQGYCLVTVRSKDGWFGHVVAVELTKVKP